MGTIRASDKNRNEEPFRSAIAVTMVRRLTAGRLDLRHGGELATELPPLPSIGSSEVTNAPVLF